MKLKPVIFVKGNYGYTAQNTTQQLMLLNALKTTQDPKELKRIIGVKTVADVYRTLDKLAMRKEYHSSLAKVGLTFDYIVKKIKKEIEEAPKSSDRLTGLGMILKSIGLDKYEETNTGGGSWEDALLKIRQDEDKGDKKTALEPGEYKVVAPEMPEHIRLKKEKENAEGKSLYE